MLNKTNGDFDEADEKVIQACCSCIAEALEMQKNSYTLEKLALIVNQSSAHGGGKLFRVIVLVDHLVYGIICKNMAM